MLTFRTKDNHLRKVIKNYGDLIYDFSYSTLWDHTQAYYVFQSVLKEIKKIKKKSGYIHYERAWILRVTSEKIRKAFSSHARRPTPSERSAVDSNSDAEKKLKIFDAFFHRLTVDEQILLILRDKYKIEFSEISNAMGIPIESLKLKRQQALRALEDWIWN